MPLATNTPTTDQLLLPVAIRAVHAAGARLLQRFGHAAPLATFDDVVTAIHANDAASLDSLRDALRAARPGAGWVEDELEGGALPMGEWWITDPVEGNINHVHGQFDWGVTATLIRDNVPVLTVAHVPLEGRTYTALRGGGAFVDGVRLRPSAKTELRSAMVATGQARPGESSETHRRIGRSVTAMLGTALVVRVTVPATFQLAMVAGGRMDAFWQHSNVRSGLVSGALLVQEAGGVVSDLHGRPWGLDSEDFLATAPGLHDEAVRTLSVVP
ncbi:inositol monophosphatase family protein [Variovorax paradoxus]|uniref:inositol monophosphatase family protein n=1 Tax=Variovorax paradoxus TaxID=34073 RepID=UPI0029C821EE|nr:inositol monophosphatase family protein [Variovorax paradoxus]